MQWLVWMLLLLAPVIGHAGALEDVAIEAFEDIQTLPHHEIWEYGGIIVDRYDHYLYPKYPVTQGKNDTVLVDVRKMLLPADKLVGLYHTHPCLPAYYSQYFSIPDIAQQIFYKVPIFILDQCTGIVHEFEMGVDHIFDTGKTVEIDIGNKTKKVHLPSGRLVGHIHAKQERLAHRSPHQ